MIEVTKMNDLLQFLTSQEIIIVYMIAALACLICFIVYLVERNNENLKRKHNTKELNKLVEEIRENLTEEELAMFDDDPVMETIEEVAMSQEDPIVIGPIEVEENLEATPAPIISEEQMEEASPVVEEELEYTTIEPDEATAKLELQKLKEQLEKEETMKLEPEEIVNQYEAEQEKQAIISLDELLSKSKEMYEANELTQYKDEGNEPISIQDLEMQVNRQAAYYDEPFIIANVVPEEELKAGINEAFEQVEEKEVLHMDDFTTIKEETVNPVVTVQEKKKFQCSPIISPIFGIERDPARDNAIALENTANYEKLDAAIRQNSEFYLSMSELEGKE